MAQTKTNLISTVKTGEFPVKAAKLIGRGPKIPEAEKLFSEKLKEITFERIDLSDENYDPGRKGLNPVKPKLEKQGGADRIPDSSDNAVSKKAADDPSRSAIQTVGAGSDGNNTYGGAFVRQSKQDFGGAQNAEMQNGVENIPAEGSEVISDVNNQSLLLQMQGVFIPQIDVNAEINAEIETEDMVDEVLGEGDNVIPAPAVDTDYADKRNTYLIPQIDKDAHVGAEALSKDLKAAADSENLPLQRGDGNGSPGADEPKSAETQESKESQDKLTARQVKSDKPYQGKLYKGTLEELLKQGEISLRDIITFTVTDKGIFIGSEGGSVEDAANLADGDLFRKLYDVLSKRLENQDEPIAREQLGQLLLSAIRKAVSDMRDPVKKEEEYQLKLMKFLMKFIEKINGRDDDKKTALEDHGEESKEGLLFQLIDNLIEASRENSEEDKKEYTAAIYICGTEIGLWTDGGDDGSQTNTAEPARAEQVGYDFENPVNGSYSDISKTQVYEAQNVFAGGMAAADAAREEEADYADASFYMESQKGAAVSELGAGKTVADADNGVKAQKAEKITAENISDVNSEASDYNVQVVYQASQNGGEASQNGAEKGKNSPASVNRHFNRRVIGASDEMEALKRLFDVKNRDDEKLKEMNELKSEEESSEDGENTEKTTARGEQGPFIGDEETKADFDKSIIEAVTVEALKADNAAVAKSYTPDERGAKQIMTQIISEMLNSLSQNRGTGKTVTTLTMTLNPESLGKITMKVSEEAGKISLLVTAHSRETAEILSQRMDAMQQAAKDNGTQLEKYQVVYGPEEDGNAGQQNYDGSSKNPYVRQDMEDEQNSGGDSRFANLLKQAV